MLDKNRNRVRWYNKREKMKKILRIVETFISVLLITLASLLSFSIAWMFKTWTNLSMEELVFHLEVPLEGTNEDMIIEYIRSCAVPTVIIFWQQW